MQTMYQISSSEFGTILIRRRKIAKAFRWWLRDNGYNFSCTHFLMNGDNKTVEQKNLFLERVTA
jgi:hypothetical protein